MVSEKRKIGDLGEDMACKYLKKQGYKVLQRNFLRRVKTSPLLAEIDIIAKNKKTKTIHFIEIKTSSKDRNRASAGQADNFSPEQRVNYAKKKKLIRASQTWLMENKINSNIKWQIDIIAVNLDLNSRKAQIKHFENIIHQ